MAAEDDLLARLRKIQALMAGEREAAGAALERVKARLAEQARCDPLVELQFSMPDAWSRQLAALLTEAADRFQPAASIHGRANPGA